MPAFAYTRDPSLLFQPPDCGFAPPLSFESILSDGRQPVRYRRRKLLRPLHTFKAEGEIVEVADIDWLQGRLVAYYNMEEAVNGIPALSVDNFRIPCEPEPVHEYIKEVLAMLRRGHSILDPSCTCDHGLSKRRCLTLGVSSLCSEFNRRRSEVPCALSRRPREFTAKEVSDELGITDAILFQVSAHHNAAMTHLLYVLKPYCTLRTEGLNLFVSSKDFVLNPVDNREDLLRVLTLNPLTISITRNQYPGILRDVQDLVSQDLVYVIESEAEKKASDADTKVLFYMNPRWNHIGTVDSDIKALWHAIKGKDISLALSSLEPKPQERPSDPIMKKRGTTQGARIKRKRTLTR
jgi:hypothetical protein